MAGTIWQDAREAARELRAVLLGGKSEDDVPAERMLSAALTQAGLRCYPRRPQDPLLSGAHAVLDPEARAVWVRADCPAQERRVYIAHELAHFHLHEKGRLCHCAEADFADPDSILAVGYGPRQRRETEANVFARELLLPVPVAHRLFHDGGRDARAIASQLGLPIPVVFAQLAEGLTLPPPPPIMGEPEAPEKPLPGSAPPLLGAGGATTLTLDPSQEAAARAESGPLLVGAGPGTGKTRTLTARVLYLTHERGIEPDNLLALTFSRKAAEEMRERIAAVAPEVAQRAGISTFHAYGLDLLRRHGKAAGLPANPVLLDTADACALLERRAASLGLAALRYLHDLTFPLPDILRTIGRSKEDMLTPEIFAERAEATGDPRLIEVAGVFAAYEALLREKGAIDYADLVCRALRLLEEDETVLAAERNQWRCLLVDEYQDVNRAGARLVQLLAGDGEGLWCVGDLRQAIYRFRGASPANVTRFQHDFPNGQRADLKVNYRSRPELVALFGVASGEGLRTWESSRRDERGATATLAVADDDRAQADGIATEMKRFVEEGFCFRDQVILCRTRAQARWLRGALTAREIPVAPGADESGLLTKPDVKDLVAVLARACEPSGPARRRFPELPEGLPFRSDASDFWTELLWGKPGWARKIKDPGAVARLLSLARAFRDRAETVLEAGEEPRRAFLRHLRRMARLGASFGDPEETGEGPDAVRLLTVHGAKGLEFPIVFVPNLSAGKFPARPGPSLLPPLLDDEEGTTLEEEARLFFVALTRARDHLVLSRAIKYGKMSAMPSPLLTSLHRVGWIRHVVWESTDGPPAPNNGGEGEETPVRSLEPAEGVSAEDAELYLRCPRRYYYERVAKLPPGERTLYGAFKRSVEEALSSPNPVAALEATWMESGPDPDHPHAPLYREAADDIVRRAVTERTSGQPRLATRRTPTPRTADSQPTLEVRLENGSITVRPDAADTEAGIWEVQTFRKPPQGPKEAPLDEPRLSLLQEAIAQKGKDAPPITLQYHYLQTDETLKVGERPKVKARHLASYERALQGIHLAVFNPTPADSADCSSCPYFFICPE